MAKAEDKRYQFGTETSMDVAALNNLVVSLRPTIKQIKVRIIHKLSNNIKMMRKKRGDEQQVASNNKKADRLVEEIQLIKKLNQDRISKFSLGNEMSFNDAAKKDDIQMRVITRLSCHKLMVDKVGAWRGKHEDWRSLAAFIQSKNTGRRFKHRSAGKLDPDSVNSMPVNTERRLARSSAGEERAPGGLGERLQGLAEDSGEKKGRQMDVAVSSDDDSPEDARCVSPHSESGDDSSGDANARVNVPRRPPPNIAGGDKTASDDGSSSDPEITDEEDMIASNSSDGEEEEEEEARQSSSDDEEQINAQPVPDAVEPPKKARVLRASKEVVVQKLNLNNLGDGEVEEEEEPRQSSSDDEEQTSAQPVPDTVEPPKKARVIRASKETVVQKLNLNNLGDGEELDIMASVEEGAQDNVSFLFDSEGSGAVSEGKKCHKKKSSFFVTEGSDSDASESDGAEEMKQKPLPPQQEDVEFDREEVKRTVESTFVGSLCSSGATPEPRTDKPRVKFTRRNERPNWQKQNDVHNMLKNMAPGRRKQFQRQAAFLEKKKLSSDNGVKFGSGSGVPSKYNAKAGASNEKDKTSEVIHPSWAASKKRKEMESKIQPFQGKKIKFDDDD